MEPFVFETPIVEGVMFLGRVEKVCLKRLFQHALVKKKRGIIYAIIARGKPWLAQKRRILRLTPALAHP